MFTRTWAKDAFERVLATFVVAALGLWVAADGVDAYSLDRAEGALTAGLIAAGTLIKVMIAGKLGQNGASLDPSIAAVEVDSPANRTGV